MSARRPELDAGAPPVRALRDYLNRYWIESQISYQEKTSGRQRAFDDRLIRATELLFALTLVAACVHIFAGHIFPAAGHTTRESPGFWEEFLIVVSITVPAWARLSTDSAPSASSAATPSATGEWRAYWPRSRPK